ncbi:conserved hypothetical protein [Ancylobacter novellus DSM 506]|uniref:Phage tail protein n=1 Tax=Ancylobacter novellus (strain ATCC 8093 / DSM 506 / JCM 20403 / CCM 1077 / IAM 12100 / NBRC 12443 / NCIMB 10456) TaxID=639283 RepID=D6ZZU5_ANCN5|nr:phage tail tube protein [Ancylobacter novellus]ADH87359.1 conserved hypothetical protein [Ancylobacter novellus DSM 506]
MAKPTTMKGGQVRVLIGNDEDPIVYAAPCGFTERSVTLSKNLEEVVIPDCDDPDAVDWVGRDASSLSMAISGEGVMAEQSVETWLDAWENPNSVPVKVEWGFPNKTITWTGLMHVESIEATGANGQRVRKSISMQSDGEMARVVTPNA